MGFSTEREFAVFKTLENEIKEDAKFITEILFKALDSELNIVDWQSKEQIQKEMRKTIKDTIRGKIDTSKLNSLAIAIVEQLKLN